MSKRVPISKRVRFTVLERDGFTCRYCGARPPEVVLHVDHKTPVVDGGGNHLDNLITACSACNLGKGVLHVSDGVDDIQERAIAASMMAIASERFGPDLTPGAFELLLNFSHMDGPQPALIALIANAASWEEAVRMLFRRAGYPEQFWTANDE